MIKERVEYGHQYRIEWCDQTVSSQSDEHLFGAFTRRDRFSDHDYVLTIDEEVTLYRLARIESILTEDNSLYVKFINLNTNNEYSSTK